MTSRAWTTRGERADLKEKKNNNNNNNNVHTPTINIENERQRAHTMSTRNNIGVGSRHSIRYRRASGAFFINVPLRGTPSPPHEYTVVISVCSCVFQHREECVHKFGPETEIKNGLMAPTETRTGSFMPLGATLPSSPT
ncbi:hypothetical protein V9T40_014774 [Parthenolecanium corni]|uniref:Uncharacterized protein n=1 Tax=Parthenolecanium corni TaxID=536013 RepID=A0AAN9TFT1_9HEMI